MTQIILTFIFSILSFNNVKAFEKVKIAVFYLANDVKSAQFFEDELKPVVNSPLDEYVDVHLNPFVNCKRENKEIICNTNIDMMYTNVQLMCAFDVLNKHNEQEETINKRAVNYVICSVGLLTNFRTSISQECMKYLSGFGLEVENCIRINNNNLTEKLYEEAQSLESRDYPVVTLNGKILGSRLVPKEVCLEIEDKPEVCSKATKPYKFIKFVLFVILLFK